MQLISTGDIGPVMPVNLNNVRLQPDAVKLLQVRFRVPHEIMEGAVVCDFALVDKSNGKTFGSPLSAVLEIGEKEE